MAVQKELQSAAAVYIHTTRPSVPARAHRARMDRFIERRVARLGGHPIRGGTEWEKVEHVKGKRIISKTGAICTRSRWFGPGRAPRGVIQGQSTTQQDTLDRSLSIHGLSRPLQPVDGRVSTSPSKRTGLTTGGHLNGPNPFVPSDFQILRRTGYHLLFYPHPSASTCSPPRTRLTLHESRPADHPKGQNQSDPCHDYRSQGRQPMGRTVRRPSQRQMAGHLNGSNTPLCSPKVVLLVATQRVGSDRPKRPASTNPQKSDAFEAHQVPWLGRPGLFVSDLEICHGEAIGTAAPLGRARTVRARNEKKSTCFLDFKQIRGSSARVGQPGRSRFLFWFAVCVFVCVCWMPLLLFLCELQHLLSPCVYTCVWTLSSFVYVCDGWSL